MSLRLRNALNFSIDNFLLFLLCIEGCIYTYIHFSHYRHIPEVKQVVFGVGACLKNHSRNLHSPLPTKERKLFFMENIMKVPDPGKYF